MKKYILFALVVGLASFYGCSDKYELQVTDRSDCYISRFSIRGADNYTVLADVSIGKGIDTVAHTIVATVKYGTDMTKLKPYCSLSPESIIVPEPGSPALGSWVDFTKGPYKYTVLSGNRQVKHTYTVTVTAQQ